MSFAVTISYPKGVALSKMSENQYENKMGRKLLVNLLIAFIVRLRHIESILLIDLLKPTKPPCIEC